MTNVIQNPKSKITNGVSRRQFVGGMLAAGAGLMAAHRLAAAEPAADPDRWVLLADCHIWERRDTKYNGVKPAENLAQERDEFLAARPRPAGVIVAGDCVFLQGHAADYAVLAELVKPLAAQGIPIHFAMGNHDDRKNFAAAFPDKLFDGPSPVADKRAAIVETPRANWFLLDSLERTNYTPGRLGKPQLEWLARELDARKDKPALIVAHHNPEFNQQAVASGRSHSLLDTAGLFEVIEPRKQVKAYFFGHTHCWHVGCHAGIHLVNIPATAWLFDKSQPQGWVDAKLRADGISLTLHALVKEHPANGKTVELTWRG
jgi:3',5'-cyclic-AMP phosphodiesterase